jgi:hypothetical protein
MLRIDCDKVKTELDQLFLKTNTDPRNIFKNC